MSTQATGSTDLNWLPSDAEEQLSLGFRIISNAYKTRVQSLEAESRALKHQLDDKLVALTALQKKHSSLEVEMIEMQQRAAQLTEENKQLICTVRKLQKDIQRLESLKQAVLHSIQSEERDDDSRSASQLYLSGEYLQTAAPLTMQDINGEPATSNDPYSRFTRNQDLGVPQTPDVSSAMGLSTPSCGLKADESSEVDSRGKAFFRQCRTKLGADAFQKFLGLVKKLNGCSLRERETIMEAIRDIHGTENADLFEEFKILTERK